MKIAINLIPFYSVQGIEVFAQNIISELLKSKSDEFFIFEAEDAPDIFALPAEKIITIRGLTGWGSKIRKAIYLQTKFYFLLNKYKIDLLFSPAPVAPFFYKNEVVTIHDCAYDRLLEFDSFLSKIYFKIMFYMAEYFSKKIVTVSKFSKKELVSLYKIDPYKIEIIYEATPILPEIDEISAQKILKKFKIDKPYFLYIGNNRPRKNIVGTIKAFKIFLKKTGLDYMLVIAGKIDKRFLDLNKEIEKNELEDNVILTDFVNDKEKTALYKNSRALFFPSFYEGFGLPVLEAQSLGIPVLTSNTSSLPEVAGNGALFVNPYDINEIAKGMTKINEDYNLRKELIKNGFENIKRFSWENSAKKLLDIFHGHEDSANK